MQIALIASIWAGTDHSIFALMRDRFLEQDLEPAAIEEAKSRKNRDFIPISELCMALRCMVGNGGRYA
jgi:hypothetical protein